MGTIIVLALLIACVGAVIFSMVKKHKEAKKSGGCCCGCGCSGCSEKCE